MSKLFVPRFRREQLQQEQQGQAQPAGEDEEAVSRKVQLETWDDMHRAIKAAVNRVTVETIELVADDLFAANVLRGRGVFCGVLAAAQLASPHLSDVFAALVARVNSRLPQVGALLLRRLLHQLWRALRLRQLESVKHTCIFLAHLSMARVCSVVVVLKLIALFLCGGGAAVATNRVLIAAALFAETFQFLDREEPEALAAVLEPARALAEDPQGSGLDARSEEALDGVLRLVREHQLRKERGAGLVKTAASSAVAASAAAAASLRGKQEQQLLQSKEQEADRNRQRLQRIVDEAAEFNPHASHDDVDVDLSAPPPEPSAELDKFAPLPKAEFDAAQAEYSNDVLPLVRLPAEQRKRLEDRAAAATAARLGTAVIRGRQEIDGTAGDDAAAAAAAAAKGDGLLVTPADFQGLADAETAQARKDIYLIFTSSIRAEEMAHKLLGLVAKTQQQQQQQAGGKTAATTALAAMQRQQRLIVSMILRTVTHEKSFEPIYANAADLLCRSGHHAYRDNFEEAFKLAYGSADSYESRQLSILAQLYAHLLRQEAITWRPLAVIDLAKEMASREPLPKSQRIFVDSLLKELAACMGGAGELADRMHYSEAVRPHVAKMFPTESAEDARAMDLFYKTIGMPQLAAPLAEVIGEDD